MIIEISKTAAKDLKRITKTNKKIALIIVKEIKELSLYKQGLNIRKLENDKEDRYRLRVGDFRIVYQIDEDILKIFTIKDRKEVYRWLKNN